MFSAVSYAAAHTNYVSDSWGTPKFSAGSSEEPTFNHIGVIMTFSAGDLGTGPLYPASPEFVTAVGGTTLTPSSNARGWAETAWSGSGSGCSTVIVKPSWEQGTSTVSGMRAETDVSAVADPSTGVAVYDTFGDPGWEVFGGTSVAAPIIASVYALAGTGGASDYAVEYPYLRSPGVTGSLNDITSGSNGSCGTAVCNAAPEAAGSSTITYRVTDAVGATSQNSFTFTASAVMPGLLGKKFAQASVTLHALGLGTPAEGFQVDCDAVGEVTSQSPSAGTVEPRGFSASLIVGKLPAGRSVCP
jgi:hypothetical protein